MFDQDYLAYLFGGLAPDDRVRQESAARTAALRGQQPPQPEPPMPVQQPWGGEARPRPAPQPPMQAPGAPVAGPQGPGSALPLATGGQAPGGPPAAQGQPDMLAQRETELSKRYQQAMDEQQKLYAPPDYAKAEEAYGKRAEQGGTHLLLAMAAQRAGEDFKPLGAHYLKQAAAAREPMKMAGGQMTETGFIEDPGYKHELDIKRSDAKIKAIDTALQGVMTAQERRRLEADKAREAKERTQMMIEGRRDLAVAVAGLKNGGDGKQLSVKAINDLTEGQNKLGTMQRLSQDFKPGFAGLGGMVMETAGMIPGVGTDANEWWRNYRKEAEIIERHGLFGAALSPTEASSWRAADINSGMPADAIQRNLERRAQVLAEHYNRTVGNLQASKWDTSAFPQVPGAQQPAAPAAGGGAGVPTATGPNGQKIKLVNGQWVPM